MELLGPASVDGVVQAYCGDSMVVATGLLWPDAPHAAFERLSILARSGRPVDYILTLTWHLYRLSRDEVLSIIHPVWPRLDTMPNFSWKLQEMVSAIKAGTFTPPTDEKRQNVERQRLRFKKAHPSENEIGILIGYQVETSRIHLEDGNTRLTAAALEDALSPTVKIYLGTCVQV